MFESLEAKAVYIITWILGERKPQFECHLQKLIFNLSIYTYLISIKKATIKSLLYYWTWSLLPDSTACDFFPLCWSRVSKHPDALLTSHNFTLLSALRKKIALVLTCAARVMTLLFTLLDWTWSFHSMSQIYSYNCTVFLFSTNIQHYSHKIVNT